MRAAVVVGVLMVLPAFAGAPRHAHHAVLEPSHATLAYPGAVAAVVKAKDGTPYKLHLEAEPTVHGTVSNLVLVVQRADAGAEAPNLLDPPGSWHGYQPYTFAATDFESGAAQSLFGANRSVCRFTSGLKIDIAVKQSAVEVAVPLAERRFAALVVEVVLDNAPVVEGHPVCK